MKKAVLMIAAAVMSLSMLAGCGGGKAVSYKDGTYTGKSEVYINEDEESEEGNGYGVVELTIEGGKITACTFTTYNTDDTLKDENYGKKDGSVANKDYFKKAQHALGACPKYAEQLVEAGSLDGVDAISGATVNYNEFKEAVNAALKEAEE